MLSQASHADPSPEPPGHTSEQTQAPTPLPLARYRFTATFDHELVLPGHTGALLRSVFGLALRRGACLTAAPSCSGCPLLRSCAYPAIFETPPRATQLDDKPNAVPNPYVMEPPPLGTTRVPAGQALHWHQVLTGPDTLRHLPLLVGAWERALAGGWGSQRVRGRLRDVAWVHADGTSTAVRDAASGRLLPHTATLALPSFADTATGTAHLHFDTPLRLQHNGRPLHPAQLSPRKLVADLLRRCNLVLDLHLGIRPAPFDARALVAHAATLTDDRSALRWREDARYSARQGQLTPLGGVLGRWTLTGDLAPLLPWLYLGQWLHLGKGATMGQGGYRLELAA